MKAPKTSMVISLAAIVMAVLVGTPPADGMPENHPLTAKASAVVISRASQFTEGEPHGVKSAAVKKALRELADMLRSSSLQKVLSWMETKGGGSVAKVIRKHASTIADTLDSLARWEEVTLEMVRGQIVAALRGVGVPQSAARTVAFWLKNFIEWVLL